MEWFLALSQTLEKQSLPRDVGATLCYPAHIVQVRRIFTFF